MAARTADYISLCSGSGMLDAGLELGRPGARAVVYVEREVTATGVLAKAIAAGAVADAPIWSDLLTFDGESWRGLVDGIAGGFPCQPHSYAGKRLGEADERNLWPVVARLVFDAAPQWCFFENVPGIAPYYWRVIRPDLQALGYEVAEGIFSAEEVGASHLRERLFILAYTRHGTGSAEQRQQPQERAEEPRLFGGGVADPLHDGYARPYSAQQGTEQRAATQRPGEAMVNTQDDHGRAGERRAEAGARSDGIGRLGPAVGCAELGDSDGERRCEAERGQPDGGRPSSPIAGVGLAHASVSGLQGRDAERAPGRVFPPGPSDAAGWRAWLEEWPGTEPAIRRDADGLAFRADRLRVAGNGVVPVAIAHGLRSLQARLGVTL